ncbi:hypothetical protein MKEN_00716800 [Mycena kentingensis (nom. inval.)]|nr:hypothetical protein MKEN_00716800 [Mycena kentingensis (nom. inval.)]
MLTRTQNTRRRREVSDLHVPPTHSQWRLTLSLDEEDHGVEIYDFPQPPQHRRDPSSSDDSVCSSADSHASLSSPATTPAASPTAPNHPSGIVRCKTIKPLTINKRALSPATPVEDDDFYASHASGFVTLSPPLPPSFPRPTSPNKSKSRSPPPMCPLPPVPTSPSRPTHSRTPSASSSLSGHVPNFSRPTSLSAVVRPPPRSSLPADASAHESVWSGDFTTYYASYAPLIAPMSSNSAPASPIRRTHTPPPPIDTLLNIPSEEEGSDEALSLSPMVATRNPDLPESDTEKDVSDVSESKKGTEKELPSLPPYTGWHSRPQITVQTSELREMLRNASPSPIPPTPNSGHTLTPTPALRSRWSASTLSAASVHVHQREETSPFKLARRYFTVGVGARSPPKEKEKEKEKKGKNIGIGKGKGKLTVDDVRVLFSPPASAPTPRRAVPIPIPVPFASPSSLRASGYRFLSQRSTSDSGCTSSVSTSLPPRLRNRNRSDVGHGHSGSVSSLEFEDEFEDDEDDLELELGRGRGRGRRRKPIPAFLGMHAK